MKATIVIPTYNRSLELQRALRSMAGEVDDDVEILVVDDASTEDIASAIESVGLPPSCRLIRREYNGGAAAARNTGVAQSRGEFVAFLDSDDEWLPGKLQQQLEYLHQHPTIAMVCTGHEIRRRDRAPEVRVFPRTLYSTRELAFGCGLSPGSTLCARRDFFDVVGAFNEAMPRLEDWDWLLRATDHSSIGILSDAMAVIHVGKPPGLPDVEIAARRMARAHKRRFLRTGVVHTLRFIAALHYERAVAAFRHGSPSRAAWWYCLSVVVYPFRSLDHFRRVARIFFSTCLRSRTRAANLERKVRHISDPGY